MSMTWTGESGGVAEDGCGGEGDQNRDLNEADEEAFLPVSAGLSLNSWAEAGAQAQDNNGGHGDGPTNNSDNNGAVNNELQYFEDLQREGMTSDERQFQNSQPDLGRQVAVVSPGGVSTSSSSAAMTRIVQVQNQSQNAANLFGGFGPYQPYDPVHDASPYYYEQNKHLYDLHVERFQRSTVAPRPYVLNCLLRQLNRN